jgi:hypothetical protein
LVTGTTAPRLSNGWNNPRREVPMLGNNRSSKMNETTNRSKRIATFFRTALLLAPLAAPMNFQSMGSLV